MSRSRASESQPQTHRVLIIGTGFSGLGMGIQLKREGIQDFVILEKAGDVGGTWRDNTYPGCACDIQSHMYSFSFEQNPNWSRSYSPQPEIWDYLKDVTDRYDLREHIEFGVEVLGAEWNDERGDWEVRTADGRRFRGQHLVSGIGGLHVPNTPKLPGIENFTGEAFHSAQWNHDYDLTGKRVAVVGTGASAVQFVPQIAPDVAELTLFQRTPPWIMPKPDHAMPGWAKKAFSKIPPLQTLYRDALYWINEVRAVGFNGHPGAMKAGELLAKRNINAGIKDPQLRRKVTPDYTMGCKRVLISNDYYPALARDNVDVNTAGIREVTAKGIVDGAGVEHEVDAIIYGTGFHVTDSFEYLDITGRGGKRLDKTWQENGIETYHGINVAGFPNLHFLLGPNTALGHNSVVFMIESQIRYVGELIKFVAKHRAQAADVRRSAQDKWNEGVQKKLVNGVWSTGGCTSWYLDSKGVNRTIWPGFTFTYWQRTRHLEQSDYELLGRTVRNEPRPLEKVG